MSRRWLQKEELTYLHQKSVKHSDLDVMIRFSISSRVEADKHNYEFDHGSEKVPGDFSNHHCG